MLLFGKKVTVGSQIGSAITDLILLYISFSVSLNLLRIEHLHFGHTLGIENISPFSPEISYPVLGAIALLTLLIFGGLKWLQQKQRNYFRAAVILLLLLSYFIGVIGPDTSYYIHNADSFHHGEQLSPALAFDQGKLPYRDIFFLHGSGEDVIVPWLSLKLFGVSIGSYYFLEGLLKLASVGIFLWLMDKLFDRDGEFLFTSVWFIIGAYSAIYYLRDIPVWIAAYLTYRIIKARGPSRYKLAGLGATAGVGLFYSLDRGLFLTALLVLMVLLEIFFDRNKDGYAWRPWGAVIRLKQALWGVWGFLGVMLVGLLLLGFKGFADFIGISYEVGKYQGAIFNQPFPGLYSQTIVEWLPLFVFIATAVVICRSLYAERRRISPETIFEAVLLLFAVAFFRAATGRPDLGHIAYGSVVIFITLFIVASRRLREFQIENLAASLPVFAVVLLTLNFATSWFLLPEMNEAQLHGVKTFIAAPTKPDSYWLSPRLARVTDYIDANSTSKTSLFVFSTEPLFYYTTRLHNPTKFYISWFADPPVLESQMLSELKAAPPTLVIYKSGQGFNDSPDFVSMTQRLPRVNAWILAHYRPKATVDGVVILQRA
jgi:hypothetical protein